MKKQRNKIVTPEVFIKAWQSASDIFGFCKATGMNIHSAQTRARIYRKRGVKLQMFTPRRGAPKLDIDKLNRIAQEAAVYANKSPVKTATPAKKIAAKKVSKNTARKHVKKSAKKKAK